MHVFGWNRVALPRNQFLYLCMQKVVWWSLKRNTLYYERSFVGNRFKLPERNLKNTWSRVLMLLFYYNSLAHMPTTIYAWVNALFTTLIGFKLTVNVLLTRKEKLKKARKWILDSYVFQFRGTMKLASSKKMPPVSNSRPFRITSQSERSKHRLTNQWIIFHPRDLNWQLCGVFKALPVAKSWQNLLTVNEKLFTSFSPT